jgi:hypothetical protein
MTIVTMQIPPWAPIGHGLPRKTCLSFRSWCTIPLRSWRPPQNRSGSPSMLPRCPHRLGHRHVLRHIPEPPWLCLSGRSKGGLAHPSGAFHPRGPKPISTLLWRVQRWSCNRWKSTSDRLGAGHWAESLASGMMTNADFSASQRGRNPYG